MFELYLQHSPIHTYIQEVTATESYTVLCSGSFKQMLGISAQDMIGKSISELFPPKLAAKINADNLEIISSGKTYEKEEELDGRYYTTIKFPIVQRERNLLAGYTVDITERKRLEKLLRTNNETLELLVYEKTAQLQEEHQRMEGIISGTGAGTWEWRIQTGETIFNERWAEIIGYTLEEISPVSIETWKHFVHPDDLKASGEMLEKHFRGEADYYEFEARIKHKNGNWVWVLDRGKVTSWSEDGKPLEMMGIHLDITKMKSLTEQLLHSQKMESIGKLAGGLAHDLNNILTVINGYATMLKLIMPQHEEPNQILSATTRAASLTHSLLAYSRKQEMQQSNQNLNQLIVNVGAFIKRIIPANIEFAISLADDDLFVFADKVQIEQVMLNLATNARDAMPGGGTFSIATSAGSIDADYIAVHGFGEIGNYAVITVSDTGHGMDAETALKVFDPFFTTKEVGKGTGLGLSMVLGIVRQHGGFVDLLSEPGKGSVFSIHLPLVAAEMAEDAPEETAELLEAASGTTLLLAEDDSSSRFMMAEFLKKAGYKVVTVADGQDAVEKFALHKDKIKLVISDVMMPRKSGKVASIEIRAMVKTTKFIFVSGHSRDELRQENLPDSDDVLMLKPLMPLELLKKIRELLTWEKS